MDIKRIKLNNAEEWREYDFKDRVYRIDHPVEIVYAIGGVTHRVLDSVGIHHLVPAPGYNGCVIRFKGVVVA